MGCGRIPNVILKGPNLVKEIAVAAVMGCIDGLAWKKYHWKARVFYHLLEKVEVSTVVAEDN